MGKIINSTFVSIDGVINHMDAWHFDYTDDETDRITLEQIMASDAMLMGRHTYDVYASAWPEREGAYPDRINSIRKYVASTTLDKPDWNNTTVLEGDVVEEVTKLKQELDGEIVIPASYQLGRTLIEHDLVDALRLVVFPVVLGAGERFFIQDSDKRPMRLVDTKGIGDGLVLLNYEFIREG